MGSVIRVYYTKAGPKGTRVRVYVKNWYAEYVGPDGKQQRVKGYTSKPATLQLLAKLEREAAESRHGLRPSHNHADRPLADLQREYLETLTARGNSPAYLETVTAHLDAVLIGNRWHTVHDFDADALTRWLSKRKPAGAAKAKFSKPSPSTLNGYLRSVKGFAKWCQKKTKIVNDLDELKPRNEKVDRRRSKRILTDAEFADLLTAAEACPRRRGTVISGRDRAMLYRVAAYTGFRASELASLTPESFDLAAKPPTVKIAPEDEKAGRGETMPLPGILVAPLSAWLKGKKANARLWPGEWAKRKQQRLWLERDVKRAKIVEFDAQGRRVIFHSLRRQYVTGLIRSGADAGQVKRLARHSSVTTTYAFYEESGLKELGDAVNKLK